MRLANNPLFPESGKEYKLVAAGLAGVIAALKKVQESANKQKTIAGRIEAALHSNNRQIEKLFSELDRAADSAVIGGEKALDGRFSRGSRSASMWISPGFLPHQRERVYLMTTGSSSLSPRHFLQENPLSNKWRIGEFQSRMDYLAAAVSAYIRRLGFAKELNEKLSRENGPGRLKMLREPVSEQRAMIGTAAICLDSLFRILQRIRAIAEAASRESSMQKKQLSQIEVSELVDEVDRVASQAEFNRMTLLQGNFARSSRVSSMWFVFPGLREERKRIFIQTMTAQALNIKHYGRPISVSQVTTQSMIAIDRALRKIDAQRKDLQSVAKELEKTREIDRKIC